MLSTHLISPEYHLQLAKKAISDGEYVTAYAELKSAIFLGLNSLLVSDDMKYIEEMLPSVTKLEHNKYYRLNYLANTVLNIAGTERISCLDVGGGDGSLSLFLKEHHYMLAEPSINNITGTKLPFVDKTFDIVVASHVLEHIVIEERNIFIDELIAKARRAVIILNPFHLDGLDFESEMRLIIKITNVQWAKEHLECSLPRLESIYEYAKDRGLELLIKPVQSASMAFALVFLEYFAGLASSMSNFNDVSEFLNKSFFNERISTSLPNSHLVIFNVCKSDDSFFSCLSEEQRHPDVNYFTNFETASFSDLGHEIERLQGLVKKADSIIYSQCQELMSLKHTAIQFNSEITRARDQINFLTDLLRKPNEKLERL